MEDKKKNPHEGHRKRVREQFMKEGKLDSFAEHNILELLLFYSSPRADTNELAHTLINRFGSLNGVFNAPYEALLEVKGVGEQTAVLLKLILELVKIYLKNKSSEIKYISHLEDSVKFIRPYFETINKEALIMVCLNNAGKILKTVVISEGASDFTQVDTRKLVQEVIFCNATQVILAHNHPGGVCAPSKADVDVTNRISFLLRSIRSRLANHIILTENDYFSFASNEKYAPLFVAQDTEEADSFNVAEGGSF